jgi:hypothetical protein
VRSRRGTCWSTEGRLLDTALQYCDFNSAATRFYTQQLIPAALIPSKPHYKSFAVQ